ncbi:MAG: nucleotidyltransferase domain-containing protein [Candidatus Thorarchaeota archaeon]
MQTVFKKNFPSKEEVAAFLEDTTCMDWHDAIIEKAIEVVSSIPEVEVILLKGSLAKGEGDIFSDIDFLILHIGDDSTTTRIRKAIMKKLSDIGDVIHYFFSTVDQETPIVYFKPWVKFELAISLVENAKNRWAHSFAKILYDRNGLGDAVVEQASKVTFDMSDHVLRISNLAIALPSFVYIVAGFVVRGEYITAIDGLDYVRNEMLTVNGLLLGLWDEGPRRAGKRFPEKVLYYYNRTRVAEVSEVWLALGYLLDWYEDWLIPRFEQLEIPHARHEIPTLKLMLRQLEKKTQNT